MICCARKGRVPLGQKHLLDFASHVEVSFHLLIFRAELLGVASELFRRALAFDGVTHCAHQQRPANLAFHEIILCALMHGRDSDGFVRKTAEDNDRHVPGLRMYA